MIKSSELNSENLFFNNSNNLFTKLPQHAIRAIVQKDILKRLMSGEEIDDIYTEIKSELIDKGAKFDTYIQENEEELEFTDKIEYYYEYYKRLLRHNTIHFPSEVITENDYVELAEKQIVPSFDYLYEDKNGEIHICKIKTSKIKNPLMNDLDKNDMYVLSLWGKEKFPNKVINIDYDYLSESSKYIYENSHNQHSFEITETFLNKLEDSFNENMENGCNPNNCATCGRNQLCNFEEPPINLGTERVIRPLSEIRLTQTQREVINNEEGISRVIAGAGAGKTLVVAMRVVELIKKGYDPSKIAMLTYTKTGAKEMIDRVIRYLAGQEGLLVDPSLIMSGTINSFCQNILNEHYDELGYTDKPVIVPEEVNYGIINDILNSYAQIPEWKYRRMQTFGPNAKWANRNIALKSAENVFKEIKKNHWTIDNNGLEGSYSPQSLQMIFLMYQNYELVMKQKCFIDYDDQIDLIYKLVERHPTLFDEYGYEHIITDEFQDSNLKQIEILKMMINSNSYKSYMAVGDDSQSIFSFQNASPEFIVNFENYFGEYKDYQLIENHRSSRNIVKNANKINELIEDRVEKDLIATKNAGEDVSVKGFYTMEGEYHFIANDIKTRIENGEDPSSIAILAATGDELRAIASELTKLGVPSVLMNPVPYKKNCRVAALCDFYDSFIHGSPKGLVEYQNVLEHGALKTASSSELDQIVENKKEELLNTPKTINQFMELANKLDELKTDVCYQDFLERIEYCRDLDELDEFFTDFELYGNESKCNKTKEGCYDGVSLITIHSAKGLEWDKTYLVLDKFDNKKYHKSPSKYFPEINEKRRLWFVGATRAKEKLICVGQYILPESNNKDGLMFNTFLKEAYKIQDKVYDYDPLTFYQEKATQLREKEQHEEREL